MDTALCVNGSESRCFTQRLSSNVSLISSCAPPLSGHWKHLRGDNKAKKIRSLSSPLLCRHFDPAPDARSTNFWRGKSLWYAFPRAQKGKAKTKNLWLQGKQRHPEIHEVALFFFFFFNLFYQEKGLHRGMRSPLVLGLPREHVWGPWAFDRLALKPLQLPCR